MDDDVTQGDPVAGHQSAGAAGELHRKCLGVTGPEGLEHPALAHGVGDQVRRHLHRALGLLGDGAHDGSERVEVCLGTDLLVGRFGHVDTPPRVL